MDYQLPLYKNILAGVSTQFEWHPEIDRAVNMAEKTGGQVSLVHAVTDADSSKGPDIMLGNLRDSSPEIVDYELASGSAWSALDDIAQRKDADVVVISSRRHGPFQALLGKMSDRILHHSNRDLLIVRKDAAEADRELSDYRHILVPVDLMHAHPEACLRASMLADNYGAEVTLLNVVEHYPVDRETTDIAREDEDPTKHQLQVRGEGLKRIAQQAGLSDAKTEVMTTLNSAARGIVDYAQEHNVDLIVAGTQKHSGLDLLLGTVIDVIVHKAHCDVLAVGSHD